MSNFPERFFSHFSGFLSQEKRLICSALTVHLCLVNINLITKLRDLEYMPNVLTLQHLLNSRKDWVTSKCL